MADPPQILVIDDDAELCELLAELLGQEGYAVESARDAISGLARAQEKPFTLVVLDVMLPGLNGFEVLTRLRQSSRVPVLMLTARGEDVDRIVGLEMGADDYLPKPFNPRELVARVRALHRRAAHAAAAAAGPGAAEAQSVLTVDDLEVFPAARRVRVRGEEVRLTTAEYDLLEVLVRQAGTVVSREDLARRVLGRRLAAYDRGIDMHVSNLRRKLGPGPSGGERIKTVRNAGYILARERP
ncbi:MULTISPECIES: response regulator transcription factor [Sorangium]|uniref:Chemotaxis protein CheY n=1 Tax=Sorangium cellulosum TaxID=56 RepID=A0A4P2QV62_SORCE|nr:MULTISPECIES: response regulator transcription factor [Sorangium]AUX34048.1 chemotaxis protein CheY [Sorangium cellulosum]WCQ93358.1 Transcriptional regulatory protein CpxR [Sorangium sp. Soce836]